MNFSKKVIASSFKSSVWRFFNLSQEIDKKYLFNFLNTEFFEKEVIKTSSWAAQKNTSTQKIKQIPIPLPPLPTQQKIVVKLDSLFEKLDQAITLTKQNLANIEELNKSILEKIFKECEEKYWSEKIWDLCIKIENWNPLNIWNEKFLYIDISSIDNKNFSIIEPKEILWKNAPSRAKQKILEWDIIFATTRPNLKNIAKIQQNFLNWTASTWFSIFRVKENILKNNFLFYFLISDIVQEKIFPLIKWANYPAISDKDLKQSQSHFLHFPNNKKS